LNIGTTKKVEAKEIGADVQKDGTVTVKGLDGKMKVLPKTGETANIALSVLGSLMVLVSVYFPLWVSFLKREFK